MDRSRAGLTIKTESHLTPPRRRRKLQKWGSKQRQHSLKRIPGVSPKESFDSSNKSHFVGSAVLSATSTVTSATHPSIPLPPDLSDSKWLEYIRHSGFMAEPPLLSMEALPIPIAATSIPELSHLALSTPPRSPVKSSSSFSSSTTTTMGTTTITTQGSIDSECSSRSTSMSRRRAKTPVFAVGQLEEIDKRRSDYDVENTSRNNNAESIAEQYRALLESRASYFDMKEKAEEADSWEDADSYRGCDETEADLGASPETAQDPTILSPHSDDGTLVSFEEETIYFKPMSLSCTPEPRSPLTMSNRRYGPSTSALSVPASPPPDHLSLQICLDLLIRELTAAFSAQPYRQSSDASALQIWLMIEAYERLKTLLLSMSLSQEEAQPLQMMFDLWLRALYAIHDSMTDNHPEDYDELQETLD